MRRPVAEGPWQGAGSVRHGLTSTLKSVLVALLWVVLGLGSLASTVIALWVVLSLSKSAAAGGGYAVWHWLVAIVCTLGLPFAIATWRHQKDARRISLSMAWLPMIWNTAGLVLASQLVPDLMASALRGQGAWVTADQLGDSHSATRVMSALGHHAADYVAPEGEPTVRDRGVAALEFDAELDIDRARAVSVPLADEGTAIFVDVQLEGHDGKHIELPYLFDTGASFTTISTEIAGKLGIAIPEDAPILTFNTASGRRESRMVYLPALRVGQVRVEGLLVSVCDGCVNEGHAGLLGQNVMRRFLANIDFQNGRMLLAPRIHQGRPNRAYDIEPVVEMKVEGTPEVWLGRVRWTVLVKNRSTVPIRDLTPTVKFTDGPMLVGKTIAVIQPGEVGKSLVQGEASSGQGGSKGHYQLGLQQAFW
jgi:hypothetical protein